MLETRALCEAVVSNSALNLTGFSLFFAISKCIQERESDSLGGIDGRGIDVFLTSIFEEYFSEASQIMILYDESWEMNEMITRLSQVSKKSFITYFLPLDPDLARRITSKPPNHFTHKVLPKATALIMFVKDESGFENILELTISYPWWTPRARIVVLVKEKFRDPGKGILNIMEQDKIFNGIVVTEVMVREDNRNTTDKQGMNIMATNTTGHNDLREELNQTDTTASLQVAALDPYPIPGQPKQFYVARWARSEYVMRTRDLFIPTIDNMRSHKLRACVFEFPPLVIKTEIGPNNYTYSGLEVMIFEELAKIMNFTYEFYEPPEGERWGVNLGNNTWTGLIGQTQKVADIGFASIFLIDNRELAVDITTPYDSDKGCFAVPRPEALAHWLGLILPFSWKVWACILAMAFIAGPTFSLITRPLKHDQSFSIGRGIFYALGSMVSTQKPPRAKSSSLRAFIIAWLLFCWLAAILYRVALIVSLTIGPSSFKVDNIKQIVRAGLEWGGYAEVLQTFTNTSDKEDQILFERFQPVLNMSAALDRVANDADFAVLDSGKYLRYAANSKYFDGWSSSIHITKDCPTSYNVGFAMPKGSPFVDRFNQVIRRMQNSGLIEKWLSNLLFEAALKAPNKNRNKAYKGLSIDNMKLCLVIVGCGYFSGFVVLCIEQCLKSYRAKKDLVIALALRKASKVSESPSVVITDTEECSLPWAASPDQSTKEHISPTDSFESDEE